MEHTLHADGWVHHAAEGLIAHLGGIWIKEADGRRMFGLLPAACHANRNGVVHGGMLMTFVDRAFGMTARLTSGAKRGATISLSHQFVAPLQIGSFATIEPKIVKLTTRMAFVEGIVFVDDQPIMQAQGVWRLTASAE